MIKEIKNAVTGFASGVMIMTWYLGATAEQASPIYSTTVVVLGVVIFHDVYVLAKRYFRR